MAVFSRTKRGRVAARTLAAVVAACGLASSVAGCQSAEPGPPVSDLAQREVRILVDVEDPKQVMMGEMLILTLAEFGRGAKLVEHSGSAYSDRVPLMSTNSADVLVGCTGNILSMLDPNRAVELEEEKELFDAAVKAGTALPADRDFLADTHIALMNSLPPSMATVEPSSAPACDDREAVQLPQNLLFVYSKGLFNRDETKELAALTKFLSTDALDKVAKMAVQERSIHDAVRQWMEFDDSRPQGKTGDGDSDSDNKAASPV